MDLIFVVPHLVGKVDAGVRLPLLSDVRIALHVSPLFLLAL